MLEAENQRGSHGGYTRPAVVPALALADDQGTMDAQAFTTACKFRFVCDNPQSLLLGRLRFRPIEDLELWPM